MPNLHILAAQAFREELDLAQRPGTALDSRIDRLQWCIDFEAKIGFAGSKPLDRQLMAKIAEEARNAYFSKATGASLQTDQEGRVTCALPATIPQQDADMLSLLRALTMHESARTFGSTTTGWDLDRLLADAYGTPVDWHRFGNELRGTPTQGELAQMTAGKFPWAFPDHLNRFLDRWTGTSGLQDLVQLATASQVPGWHEWVETELRLAVLHSSPLMWPLMEHNLRAMLNTACNARAGVYLLFQRLRPNLFLALWAAHTQSTQPAPTAGQVREAILASTSAVFPSALANVVAEDGLTFAERIASIKLQYESDLALLYELTDLNGTLSSVSREKLHGAEFSKLPWIRLGRLWRSCATNDGPSRQILHDTLESEVLALRHATNNGAPFPHLDEAVAMLFPHAPPQNPKALDSWIKSAPKDCEMLLADKTADGSGEVRDAFVEAWQIMVERLRALGELTQNRVKDLSNKLVELAGRHPERIDWVRSAARYMPQDDTLKSEHILTNRLTAAVLKPPG